MANLGLPPGPLAAYLGVRNANQDAGINTIQQAAGVQGLLAKINADRKEQAFRGELNALGPNPDQESLVQLAAKYAAPKEILQNQQSSLDRKAQIAALMEQKDADRRNRLAIAQLVAETRKNALQKPPADMRYDADGNLKPIPGSKLDLKQKNDSIKARGAVDSAERFSSALVKNIDELIGPEGAYKPHPGLRGSVGYIDEKLPPFTEAQANAKALVNALKAKTSVEGLTALRQYGTSPGSITEKEWPIFQNALSTIDPSQGETQFVQQLKDARRLAKEYAANAKNRYNEMALGESVAELPPAPVNPDMPPPGAVRRKK